VPGGASYRQLRRELATKLAAVVEGAASPAVERVRAGVLLGNLGDPRPGVCDLPGRFVAFAGGRFVIGEPNGQAQYKDETNDQALELVPFELARYLLTNAQYQPFIDEGGYDPSTPWWKIGRDWLWSEQKRQPSYWDDPRYGIVHPNHPVVGVTWYEATAFAAWLTRHLKDGYIYRLPSEAEWEYAARGIERRSYPWGVFEPDRERANYDKTHSGTTAVGCFPQGATQEGLLDMAGNVWEWTGSEYRPYPYVSTDGREDMHDPPKKRFTPRGGSWLYSSHGLRAARRNHHAPGNHGNFLGFRLARHLPR
jgi:formylglycine-generating enzyme required for sulfatase activity